jgi:predicted metalloprotease
MNHRRQTHRGQRFRWSFSGTTAAILCACAALVLAGCDAVVGGQAVSPLYDPVAVGGLPAKDGPSGMRDNAPQPTGTAHGADYGENDKLALLAVNDVEEFWKQSYSESLKGTFTPIEDLVSYDSKDPAGPPICGKEPTGWPTPFTARRKT